MGAFLAVRAAGSGVVHINGVHAISKPVITLCRSASGRHAAHPPGAPSVALHGGHARATAAA